MNSHFPNYYGKNDQPTDTQSPNPVVFLSVKNTTFKFLISYSAQKTDNLNIGEKNLYQWLEAALSEHGIGAKTAVGYGRMSKV